MPNPGLARSPELADVFQEDRYILLALLVAPLATAPFTRTYALAAAAIFALAAASLLVTFRSSGVRITWPQGLLARAQGSPHSSLQSPPAVG